MQNSTTGGHSSAFSFRLIHQNDLEQLHAWLNAPHVSERWGGPVSMDEVRERYGGRIMSDMVFLFFAILDGKPFGFIQIYNDSGSKNPWYSKAGDNVWGIDQFIGDPGFLGKGYGTRMVSDFLKFAFAKFKPRRIVTDPAPDHLQAIRCYEKAGFRKVGEVDSPDGPALLMEAVQESSDRVQRHFTGAPWESKVAYCRAIRAGNQIFISGTAPVANDGSVVAPGDGYAQAKRCLEIIKSSLEHFGAELSQVVRIRMFVTDISRWEEFGRAHHELFSMHPPATTMIEIKSLIDPKMLIEIEADAVL